MEEAQQEEERRKAEAVREARLAEERRLLELEETRREEDRRREEAVAKKNLEVRSKNETHENQLKDADTQEQQLGSGSDDNAPQKHDENEDSDENMHSNADVERLERKRAEWLSMRHINVDPSLTQKTLYDLRLEVAEELAKELRDNPTMPADPADVEAKWLFAPVPSLGLKKRTPWGSLSFS